MQVFEKEKILVGFSWILEGQSRKLGDIAAWTSGKPLTDAVDPRKTCI